MAYKGEESMKPSEMLKNIGNLIHGEKGQLPTFEDVLQAMVEIEERVRKQGERISKLEKSKLFNDRRR